VDQGDAISREVELRSKEHDLKVIQRIAKLGSWELDLSNQVLTCSDETYRLLGAEVGEHVDFARFLNVVHPNDRGRVEAANQQALSGAEPLDIIYRIISNGRARWVRERGEFESVPDGAPGRFFGTIQDISEQHFSQAMARWESRVLEVVSEGESLQSMLASMVVGLDCLISDAHACVFLQEEATLELMACTELPGSARDALGLVNLDDSQPWALAARLAAPVYEDAVDVVDDWTPACWSFPSLDADGECVGLLVLFVAEPRKPDPSELDFLARFSQLLRLAVERSERDLALRRSEAVLSIASRVGKLGGWSIDLTSMACQWSAETRAIHAIGGDEELDLFSLIDFYKADVRGAISEAFERCIEGGAPFDLELPFVNAAGEELWVRTIGEAVRDSHGQIVRVQGALQDITAQKSSELALVHSEERFRLLSNATNDAIWDWDLLTDKVWWNEGYQRLFGYSTDGSSCDWKEHIHSEDRERVAKSIQHAIDNGAMIWGEEYRYLHRDGSVLHVNDRGYILRGQNGEPVRMVGGMSDLTEIRRSERRLLELATLLDKAQDAILVRDLEHCVRFWNKSAERLYGWTAEEVLGQLVDKILFKEPAQFYEATSAALAHGEWVGELEQVTKSGTTVVVEGHWTLVKDDDGRPKSILAINTDITERKRLEKKFLRAQRMETVGTLAGGIAHDLNNMLTPIMMSITLLKEDETDEIRLRDLTIIETSAQRGADMVRQLLTFARGGDGGTLPVDLSIIAADIRKIVRDTFPKNVEVRLESLPVLWKVSADPTQIHQVFTNLCVNARDAMPDGGVLTLKLEHTVLDEAYSGMNVEAAAGPYVVIVVIDTGVGMPPEVLDRMFEPFFTTKELGKGTGLGLSTVHSIVHNHGGFIHVYSEEGKGSTFKVYLPAIASAFDAEEAALVQSALPRGQGELILVVDDEETIRNVSKRTLERFGYRVMLASNGAEAVSLYAQNRNEIAVVITDMAMPVMDGPATIVALKSIDLSVKIIGSSGLDANGSVAKAVDAGVQHFVPKPYTAETMLRILRAVLEENG